MKINITTIINRTAKVHNSCAWLTYKSILMTLGIIRADISMCRFYGNPPGKTYKTCGKCPAYKGVNR